MAEISWSTEEEDKLIELWEQRPSLYASNSKSYHNKIKKQKDFEEIAFELEKPVLAVMQKISNLRTQFARLIKPPASGSERKRRTTRQEWIFRQLDFLRHYIKARKSTNSATFPIDIDVDSSQLEDDDDQNEFLDEEGDSDMPSSSATSPVPSPVLSHGSSANKKNKSGSHQREASAKRWKEVNLLESLAKSLSEPIKIVEPDYVQENEDDIFGKLVAIKLKNIKDKQIKGRLTCQILQQLTEAQLQDSNKTPAQETPKP